MVRTSTCTGCGTEFAWVNTQGRTRTYCPGCISPTGHRRTPERLAMRREVTQRYRARRLQATVEHFRAEEVYERDGWICQLCLEPVDREAIWPAKRSVSLDHVIPLSLGGQHTRANTQCSHLFCNCAKGARLMELDHDATPWAEEATALPR